MNIPYDLGGFCSLTIIALACFFSEISVLSSNLMDLVGMPFLGFIFIRRVYKCFRLDAAMSTSIIIALIVA